MSYVVIEGHDLAGKSTLIKQVKETLEKSYKNKVFLTSELSRHNSHLKEIYRKICHDNLSKKEQYELVEESRRISLTELVKPALERGDIVISDRSFISTMVYQQSPEFGMQSILFKTMELYKELGIEIPSVVLLLSVDYETFVERSRNKELDAIETRLHNKEIFDKLKEDYRSATIFTQFFNSGMTFVEQPSVKKSVETIVSTIKPVGGWLKADKEVSGVEKYLTQNEVVFS